MKKKIIKDKFLFGVGLLQLAAGILAIINGFSPLVIGFLFVLFIGLTLASILKKEEGRE